MKTIRAGLLACAFFTACLSPVMAQYPDDQGLITLDLSAFVDDSLDQTPEQRELLGLNTLRLSDSPGTYYKLTRQEIDASGARDLFEILNLIPAIQFGTDVDQVIGMGLRGLWSHEGKYRVLLNGMSLNELDYGTFALVHRMVLDNLAYVEVLIGPGSSQVGGTATMGTINLVTYAPGESDGSALNANVGATRHGISWMSTTAHGNHYLGNETFGSYYISMIGGPKTTSRHIDPQGHLSNFRDSTAATSNEMFFGVRHKGLSAQFFNNDYSFDVFGERYRIMMRNMVANVNQIARFGPNTKFSAGLTFQSQEPWTIRNSPVIEHNESNTHVLKYTLDTQLESDLSTWMSFSGGVRLIRQQSRHDLVAASLSPFDPRYREAIHEFNGLGMFSQVNLKNNNHNLILGVRTDINDIFDISLAPRLSYALVSKNAFVKASLASAYRLPTLENIHYGPDDYDLKTERIVTREVKVGWTPKKVWSAEISIFQNKIADPIVYVYIDSLFDNYLNRPAQSNEGVEVYIRYKRPRFFMNVGWSYYKTTSDSVMLPEVWVPGGLTFQAMAAHKGTLLTGINLNKNWAFGVQFFYLDHITTLEPLADEEAGLPPHYVKHPPVFFSSANFTFTEPRTGQWKFSLRIHNLTDTRWIAGSPYGNSQPSFPMNGREVSINVNYQITR